MAAWPPHGGNLMEEGMGFPGGAVDENFGSHPTSALLIQRRECCIVYRFQPCADPPNAAAFSVVRCTDSSAARAAAIASRFARRSLTVSTCPSTPIEKI